MTGRKTLSEVRAELEAALGAGPTVGGAVGESLRRFLTHGRIVPELSPRETPPIPQAPEDPDRAKAVDPAPPGH